MEYSSGEARIKAENLTRKDKMCIMHKKPERKGCLEGRKLVADRQNKACKVACGVLYYKHLLKYDFSIFPLGRKN